MSQINIEDLTRIILEEIKGVSEKKKEDKFSGAVNGIFENIETAIEAAYEAQKQLFNSKLELREKIIKTIRKEILKNIKLISELAVEETGMGRVNDKILKNTLAIEKTPGLEDLVTTAFTGDDGLTMLEYSPYGVIGAIAPSTNPSETIICNAIGMIAAGNAVVFAPHPGAKVVSQKTIELINIAIERAGGPKNLVVTVKEPSLENASIMMKHELVKMLCATGGPGVVKSVLSSGKKAIGAGAGNPPVLVDETADIEKAAKDIVNGASFDNNLPCIAEKEVVAVDAIADRLINEMQKNNAYLIKDAYIIDKLEKEVVVNGKINRKYVGKNADFILKSLGINVPETVRVIIMETDKNHIFAKEELLMPILPVVRVANAEEGIVVSKMLENGNRHTATVHSKNVDVLSKYARELETTILVKNGPSYAGIGAGGEGYTTFTIAGPTGEGLTTARSFARIRRCALIGNMVLK